ncbi:hypothetical protein GLS40_03080, partial [Pseudooceanicola sp. 216_PA32_1]|nr:hypothetical protein [Pseudooceanicola pacificus]
MLRTSKARVAGRRAFRFALPVVLGLVCLWLLRDRLAGLEMAEIASAVRAVSPGQWLAAAGATALSFWAVGRYDAVIHRHLRTGLAPGVASRAGAAAVALSQVLGLGPVTGTLVRWRILPALDAVGAARVTAAVTAS